MKKSLNKAPARLQRMRIRLQRYPFIVKYKIRPTLYLVDTLSRTALPHPITARVRDCDVFRMEVESENNARNPRLTESNENQLREETRKDTIGWPADKADIPESLRPGTIGTNCQ